MEYFVELQDRNFNSDFHTDLIITPIRYSNHAIGGPEYAELKFGGSLEQIWQALNYLRYNVIIRDKNYDVVWHGFISEVQINTGGLSIGKTIDSLTNKVKVFYTYNDADGNAIDAITDWIEDENSISKYGQFENIESISDLNEDEANAYAEQQLLTFAKPLTTISFNNNSIDGLFVCKGWWSSLEYKIFNKLTGFEQYNESGNYEHLLGVSFTATDVAFSATEDKIHTLSDKLSVFREDDFIIVSGAAEGGNNNQFRIITSVVNEPEAYTASTISFDPSDDILDSANGFDFVESNELIFISGAVETENNGYFFTKTDIEDGHIAVNPSSIVEESAGTSITLTQGHSLELDGVLTEEFPANSITVTSLGVKIAQSFELSFDEDFTLTELYVRLKRVGSPSDQVRVSIYSDNSDAPNTQLATATVDGADIPVEIDWVKFTFSYSLTYETTYWIVVERTSTNSITDYYTVDLNSDAEYSNGEFKLYNGSSWITRPVTTDISVVDMPFQLWAQSETTDQILDILETTGQFFTDIEIFDDSGINKRQFRDGNNSGLSEIENLMNTGKVNGKRFLSNVTVDRIVQIYEEPVADIDKDPMIKSNGAILDVSGVSLTLGKIPVGKWIYLTDIPANIDDIDYISPSFIERVEIDCELQKISSLEFKGVKSPWEE